MSPLMRSCMGRCRSGSECVFQYNLTLVSNESEVQWLFRMWQRRDSNSATKVWFYFLYLKLSGYQFNLLPCNRWGSRRGKGETTSIGCRVRTIDSMAKKCDNLCRPRWWVDFFWATNMSFLDDWLVTLSNRLVTSPCAIVAQTFGWVYLYWTWTMLCS